jgi:hypothetical protein
MQERCPPAVGVRLQGSCGGHCSSKDVAPSCRRALRIREKTKVGEYLVADSSSAVVALAQMAWSRSILGIQPLPNARTGWCGIWILDLMLNRHRSSRRLGSWEVLKTLGLTSWVSNGATIQQRGFSANERSRGMQIEGSAHWCNPVQGATAWPAFTPTAAL